MWTVHKINDTSSTIAYHKKSCLSFQTPTPSILCKVQTCFSNALNFGVKLAGIRVLKWSMISLVVAWPSTKEPHATKSRMSRSNSVICGSVFAGVCCTSAVASSRSEASSEIRAFCDLICASSTADDATTDDDEDDTDLWADCFSNTEPSNFDVVATASDCYKHSNITSRCHCLHRNQIEQQHQRCKYRQP